jgi:hypothetical protein
MGIVAVVFAAALVNVFAPHAVHAAVAALVEVSNPATSPALTSRIDDPGRIPYQIYQTCNGCSSFNFGPVPSNHRLVVEHISGNWVINSPTPVAVWEFIEGNAGILSQFFLPFNTANGQSRYDQPVHFYVDAGQTFLVGLGTQGGGGLTGFIQSIALTGYLLDCNAGPCAAIASF